MRSSAEASTKKRKFSQKRIRNFGAATDAQSVGKIFE